MDSLEEKIAKIMAASTPTKLDSRISPTRVPSSAISTPESSGKISYPRRNLDLSMMEPMTEEAEGGVVSASEVEDPEITGETPFKDLEQDQDKRTIQNTYGKLVDAANEFLADDHLEENTGFDNEPAHPRRLDMIEGEADGDGDGDGELTAQPTEFLPVHEYELQDQNHDLEYEVDPQDDVEPLRASTSLEEALQFSPPTPAPVMMDANADTSPATMTPKVTHSPVRNSSASQSFVYPRINLPSSDGKSGKTISPDSTTTTNSPYLVAAGSGGIATSINTPMSQKAPKVTPRSRAVSSERKGRPSVGFGRSSSSSSAAPEFTPQHRRLPSGSLTTGGPRTMGTPNLRESFSSSGLGAAEASFHELYANWSLGRKQLAHAAATDYSRLQDNRPDTAKPDETGNDSITGLAADANAQSQAQISQLNNSAEAKIKVAVRVRPFSIAEKQQGGRRIVSSLENRVVIVNPSSFDADPDAIVAATAAVQGAEWARAFKFNDCLWSYDPEDTEDEYIDQEGVHRAIGLEIVENVLNGISSCCFAYGHTGTGKTHSFFGNLVPPAAESDEDSDDLSKRYQLSEQSGLIPRVLTDVIEGLRKKDGACEDTKMTLSFMEIYNERIRDLLQPSQSSFHSTQELEEDSFVSAGASTIATGPVGSGSAAGLRVREHPILGPYVDKLTKVEVTSPLDALRLLYEGHKNRATAQTQWNAESSRSHAVVTLELTPRKLDSLAGHSMASPLTRTSLSASFASTAAAGALTEEVTPFVRLQMVDLAGSEQAPLIPRENLSSQRPSSASKKGLRESLAPTADSVRADGLIEKQENKFIRRSLSTLGYIIKALGKGANFKSLPYRDTVLTWLLRDSLNGQNHTTMLATISPAHNCYEETLNTLKYAERLCSISTRSNHLGEYSLFGTNEGAKSSKGRMSTGGVDDSFTADEYAHIFQSLGANRPGTKAYRQLLKQTVTDPQQRLARLFGDQQSSDNINAEDNVLSPEDEAKITDLTHTLQNRITELELELKATCIERDSYAVELQTAREQLLEKSTAQAQLRAEESQNSFFASGVDIIRKGSGSGASSRGGVAPATVQVERELAQMREVVLRKEDLIERLQSECRNEQRMRVTIEENAKERLTEIQSLLIQLQR